MKEPAKPRSRWPQRSRWALAPTIAFTLATHTAHALEIEQVANFFKEGFSKLGTGIQTIVSDDQALLGLIGIITFIAILAIIASALRKVKIFEGEGGVGLSKPGKMLSVAISLGATTALIKLVPTSPFFTIIRGIIDSFGMLFALGVLTAIYFTLRKLLPQNGALAITLTGITGLLLSIMLVRSPTLMTVSLLALLVGIMLFLRELRGNPATAQADINRHDMALDNTATGTARDTARDADIGRQQQRIAQQEDQALSAEQSARERNQAIEQELRR